MSKRLTKDQEEWWEYLAGGGGGDFTDEHCDLAAQALAEVRALRAERDDNYARVRDECAKAVTHGTMSPLLAQTILAALVGARP